MASTIPESNERSNGAVPPEEESDMISIDEVSKRILSLMRELHPNAAEAQYAVAADFSQEELESFIQTYWHYLSK